jgi:hypothetical protein
VDSGWAGERVVSGLSSGEGLIHAVRDATEEQQPIKDPTTKRVTGHQAVQLDAGVGDKRLMVVEPEFSSALRVAEREGNTLSAVMRQAWDSGALRILTRNRPEKATGAHISVIAHITKDELLRHLSTTDTANGFANRFLWTCVRRSKLLPDGGAVVDLTALLGRLSAAVQFARATGQMARDSEAGELWHVRYSELSRDRLGLFGAVTTRAEAITLRLSCLYALLDCAAVIRAEHLAAALEVWRYCEDSARFIFGLGGFVADTILAALRGRPEGMTRTDLRNLFDRNKSTEAIGGALAALERACLARSQSEPTGGRPVERWFAA